MIKLFLSSFIIFAAVFTQAGKVALVGDGYGKHEIKLIINQAVVSPEVTYLYENCGVAIPIDRLDQFSLLIVASSVATPVTSQGLDKLHKWVAKGGHLILIQGATLSLMGNNGKAVKDNAMKWSGFAASGSVKNTYEAKVLVPGSPLLAGLQIPSDKTFLGATYHFTTTANMQNVIGSGSYCLAGFSQVEQGWVAFLGEEYFRMLAKNPGPAKYWLEIIKNLIKMAAPEQVTQLKENLLGQYQKENSELLIWDREWQRGEVFGPRFDPPLPAASELITELNADMAIGEYESIQLNITPIKTYKQFKWQISGNGFPAEKMEFLVQARPNPIPWPKNPAIAKEFPYWLIPPQYLEPFKADTLYCPPPGETLTVWLRISSFDIKPGTYVPNLKLTFDDGRIVNIPVKINIYPVAMPDKKLIVLGVGGQVYGDVNKPDPAVPFANDLHAHSNEWGLINVLRPSTIKVAGTDRFLNESTLRSLKNSFERNEYPDLDFSSLDPWMEQSISHNFTMFRTPDSSSQLRSMMKQMNCSEELKQRIEYWFLKEASKYIKEKGVRILITSRGDELNRDEIYSTWLPWAKQMAEAGWDCTSAFSFGNMDYAQLVKDISPYVKLWTLNQGLIYGFIDNIKTGKIKIREDAIIGTYGAGEGRGSEFRKPLSESRYLGWESWKSGVRNCMPNPYFKGWIYYCDYGTRGETGGIGGERWVSYIRQDDLSVPLAACPFWEGIREGIEEGNLAAIMTWYLDALNNAGKPQQELSNRLNTLVSNEQGAVIKREKTILKRYGMDIDSYRIKASRNDYKKAKKELLSMLTEIAPAAKTEIKASLLWGEIPLLKDGRILAAIYEGDVSAAKLQQQMKKLSGIDFPVFKMSSGFQENYPVHIIIGNGKQNPITSSIVKNFNIKDASEVSPGKKSYFIRELSKDNKQILLISGPDAEGTAKGVEMFAMFLKSYGNWLR